MMNFSADRAAKKTALLREKIKRRSIRKFNFRIKKAICEQARKGKTFVSIFPQSLYDAKIDESLIEEIMKYMQDYFKALGYKVAKNSTSLIISW